MLDFTKKRECVLQAHVGCVRRIPTSATETRLDNHVEATQRAGGKDLKSLGQDTRAHSAGADGVLRGVGLRSLHKPKVKVTEHSDKETEYSVKVTLHLHGIGTCAPGTGSSTGAADGRDPEVLPSDMT